MAEIPQIQGTISNTIFDDALSSFELGVNSGVEPILLPKQQLAWAINATVRGGHISDRPPFQRQTLNYNDDAALQTLVETGFFQGAAVYRPDFGVSQIIAQIAGHEIAFTPVGDSWTVTDISIAGDLNDATTNQTWMWQSEKWLIIQDGTGKPPIFYDGVSCRRSYGDSTALATTLAVGNFPNPRVIGEVFAVTLSAPYSGPFNITVLFNGARYQLQQFAAGAGNSTVTNGSATAGGTVVAGTQAIVKPSYVGRISSPGIGIHIGLFNRVTLNFPFPHNLLVGDQIYLPIAPPVTTNWTVETVTNATTVVAFLFNPPAYGVGTLLVTGSLVTRLGVVAPDVIVGTTTTNFLVPAIGADVNIDLDTAYTGPADQIVWIDDQEYQINQLTAAPAAVVYLKNLTDTADAGAPIPAEDILTVPELPAGRMGAYGMGRNWVCLTDGISYVAGDLVGGSSGTAVNDYRDAVLKITENTFLAGGGKFRLPQSGNIITSMTFVPLLDTSQGQGPLQIGTDSSIFSNNSPVDRSEWASLDNPIQTQSLIGQGPLAQKSAVVSNSDILFRSIEGLGSLKIARREFVNDMGGNTPISREVERALQNDNISLLPYGSAVNFDNRFLTTCYPSVSASGVFHQGLVALNFDLVSNLRGKAPPVYDGLWTGLNFLQAITGNFSGLGRAFAFGFNLSTNRTELYELLRANQGHFDNGSTRIIWEFETPVMFRGDIKPIEKLCRLLDGEFYVQDVDGTVHFKVEYRPDYYPCWLLWREFDICADLEPTNSQPGYRTRLSLGDPPSDACEPGNNRMLRVGHFFQFKFTITGHCKFMNFRAQATLMPEPDFAQPLCDPICAELVIPEPGVVGGGETPGGGEGGGGGGGGEEPPPAELFSNNPVYFTHICFVGETLTLSVTPPAWITVDTTSNRLVGALGTYFGNTQQQADALAQAALDEYGNAAVANGQLTCEPPPSFDSEVVYFVHACGGGETLTYVGDLPAWITLDTVNDRLVGAAGAYQGETQIAANAAAQAAIDAFGNAAVGDETLFCQAPAANVCDGGFTDRFRLAGYVDDSFTMCEFQEVSAAPVWDGTFPAHIVYGGGFCRFYNDTTVAVSGAPATAFRLEINNFVPGIWTMTLQTFSFGDGHTFWQGTLAGASPAGVYTRTTGCDATATLTVEQYTP